MRNIRGKWKLRYNNKNWEKWTKQTIIGGSDLYENTLLTNATIGHTIMKQPNHVEVPYIEITINVASEIL